MFGSKRCCRLGCVRVERRSERRVHRRIRRRTRDSGRSRTSRNGVRCQQLLVLVQSQQRMVRRRSIQREQTALCQSLEEPELRASRSRGEW